MKRLRVAHLAAILTLGILIPACSQRPETPTVPLIQVSTSAVPSGTAPATATVSRSDRVSTQGAGTVTARAVALQTALVEATLSAPPTIAPPTSLSPLPEGRIAFSAYIGPHAWGHDQIFVLDTSGTITQLTHDENNNLDPVWSPDGQWIAFISYVDSRIRIRIISADDSGRSPLIAKVPDGVSPTWSPDGREIIFVPLGLGEEGAVNLLRMNLDGTGQTLISVPWARMVEANALDLAWSPDGQWLAFTHEFNDVEYEIVLLNLNTHAFGESIVHAAEHPSWSPDGKRIAFSMFDADFTNRDIYVMNMDGTGLVRLTDDPGFDTNPTWSPSGQYIIFACGWAGVSLCIMNSDGTGQTGLTDGGADSPNWGP